MITKCDIKRCRHPTGIGYEVNMPRVHVCWDHWDRHCNPNDKFVISRETVKPEALKREEEDDEVEEEEKKQEEEKA